MGTSKLSAGQQCTGDSDCKSNNCIGGLTTAFCTGKCGECSGTTGISTGCKSDEYCEDDEVWGCKKSFLGVKRAIRLEV